MSVKISKILCVGWLVHQIPMTAPCKHTMCRWHPQLGMPLRMLLCFLRFFSTLQGCKHPAAGTENCQTQPDHSDVPWPPSRPLPSFHRPKRQKPSVCRHAKPPEGDCTTRRGPARQSGRPLGVASPLPWKSMDEDRKPATLTSPHHPALVYKKVVKLYICLWIGFLLVATIYKLPCITETLVQHDHESINNSVGGFPWAANRSPLLWLAASL